MIIFLKIGRCVSSRPIPPSTNSSTSQRDRSCRKSSGFKVPLSLIVGAPIFLSATPLAATQSNHEIAKSAAEPIADVVAFLLTPFIALFNWLDSSSLMALLLSTAIAAFVAFRSIKEQRSTTRTRETFAAVRKDLWDKDVLEARRIFSKVKHEVKQGSLTIAMLGKDIGLSHDGEQDEPDDEIPNPTITQAMAQSRPTETDEEKFFKQQRAVNNILNDLENIALGIRRNILDEEYLYRWMRTQLLEDWHVLSPLVTAYRQTTDCDTLYIEFEGLAAAWANEQSYADKRRLEPPKRAVSIT